MPFLSSFASPILVGSRPGTEPAGVVFNNSAATTTVFEVVEGERLPESISMRVVDSSGAPLAGKPVLASLSEAAGQVSRADRRENGMPSRTQKGLLGASSTTDGDGWAHFPDLRFQTQGTPGSFKIRFSVEGRDEFATPFDTTVSFNVKSSVATCEVQSKQLFVPVAGKFTINPGGDETPMQQTASFILQATDKLGNGIAGKHLQVTLLINRTNDVDNGNELVPAPPEFGSVDVILSGQNNNRERENALEDLVTGR